MQRWEVSGAVRPLYGSLGVKGLRNVSYLDCLYTCRYTVASPVETNWQWHLNVTSIPCELARSECPESGGLTRTLRIQNFLIVLWTTRCAYKTHRHKMPFILPKQPPIFFLYWKMGSNRAKTFVLYFTLKFCFGCPMMFVILPKHVAMFGDRGSTVVKVLCYKAEGSWFDSRWCHWKFSLT